MTWDRLASLILNENQLTLSFVLVFVSFDRLESIYAHLSELLQVARMVDCRRSCMLEICSSYIPVLFCSFVALCFLVGGSCVFVLLSSCSRPALVLSVERYTFRVPLVERQL